MPEERGRWGRQLEFILTLVGYAVGLGNVWRFPYLCYKSGGGAFLIPYVISLVFLGIPLFALEVSFGQFGGQGPTTIWSINPAAKGIGMASVSVSFIICTYYSVVIAWALRFLIASFTSSLPWVDCESCSCLFYRVNTSGLDLAHYLQNNTLGLNCSDAYKNISDINGTMSEASRAPSEVFFTDTVLGATSSIEVTGDLRWELLLTNLLAYFVTFLVLVKGIHSLGKVAYFTAIFPYVLLTIFLVRVALLEGAGTGVRYYLEPDWSRLSDATVWSDAVVQIFFSLSACQGGLTVMASYNNFRNNCIRDSFLVPIINCLTSFFAGFVVFATMGYMAHIKDTSVEDVTKGGAGLIFIVYPEAIAQMPVSPLWAILFFFMISVLGFSSLFTLAETVMTSLTDEFPGVFKTTINNIILRAGICLILFLLGIPNILGSGSYLLEVVDGAILGFPTLVIGLLEFTVIVIIYGYDNFAEDLKSMLGWRPPFYFRVCWNFISPALLVAVIIFKAYQTEPKEVDWENLINILIILFPISLIVGWCFYYACTKSKMTAFTPAWRDRRQTPYQNSKNDLDLEMTGNSTGADRGPIVYEASEEGHANTAFTPDADDIKVKL